MTPDNDALQERRWELDFSVFAWFFALAVLFQLARGDMGLFPFLRSTPDGTSLGDGLTAQIWFLCALLTLAFPTKVWCVVLLGAAGVLDFWWRLPIVTPSVYFHALVSAQILLTATYLVARHRRFRIRPAAFIESFRTPVLGLIVVLFCFAVFHKLTYASPSRTAGFFHLLGRYYVPFLPTERGPIMTFWFLTVAGEAVIAAALFFRRTRPAGLVLGVGFACLVGAIVYGFGSIVLASLTPLAATYLVIEPFDRLALTRAMRRWASPQTWRFAFTAAIASAFLIDHATGFTLADRGWMFAPRPGPTTADVLTPMQVVWFIISTLVLIAVLVAARHRGSAIVARLHPPAAWIAYALPVFFLLSEAGLYVGVKEGPNVAMFSAVSVASCQPNHFVVRDRFYSSFSHRDLLLVRNPQGEMIGIPALTLRAASDRAKRYGEPNPLVEMYRRGKVSRLRDGVEEPFDFEDLDDVSASSWLEVVLPRRLFSFGAIGEADLRCSMPELFANPPEAPR